MAVGYITAMRNDHLALIVARAGASAKLKLYTAPAPATGGAGTTLLATLTCSAVLGTILNGVLTFNAVASDTSADATGVVGWARLTTSGDVFVMDFKSVTLTGLGGDLTMDNTSVTATGTVSCGTITYTDGHP